MESLSSYLGFWLIYLASGLLGFWCWGRMFKWMGHRGFRYHLISAAGAVLIFTPVPVASDAPGFLAPGFVVFAFNLLSGELGAADYLWVWFGVAATLAFGITLILSFAGLLPDSSPDETPVVHAPKKHTSRRDNPFR